MTGDEFSRRLSVLMRSAGIRHEDRLAVLPEVFTKVAAT